MLRKRIACSALVLFQSLLPALANADILSAPVSVTASSEFAVPQYAVTNLFDATVTNADVGNTLYGQPDGQWAGVGAGPFNVFMDFGSSLTGVDGFAYSQRQGATPTLDKVGKVDFWFSNTNFGGVLPVTPANASITVTNVTTRLFTQYSFGQNEFSGRYVAARFTAPTGGGGNIGGSEFRLTTNTPGAINPELIINRASGNIRLANDTPAPVNFIAYEIVSAAGGLNAGPWTSIATNYDAGSPGPNQVDPTDNWIKFTTGSNIGTSLAEGELPGGNGATLGVGKSIDLGNSWLRTPYEDLELRLLKDDGSLHTTIVRYTGSEIVRGDLNNNGTVGPEDWPLFRTGLGSLGTGLTLAQTYGQGDLDGDLDTDLVDFRQFEAIYDVANGAGSLQSLIGANVPEPSTLGFLISLLMAGLCPRRGTSIANYFVRQLSSVRGLGLTIFAGAMALVQAANAQVFTLTNPAVPTAATANSEFGGDFVVGKLFDNAVTAADLGVKEYTPATTTDYAGVGPEPKEVFMDYGQSISANYLAFAQRLGGDFLADKIGTIDLWFSNTDFANALPATQPNKTINVTDLSLDGTATLTPYSLGGVLSGRYVAARLTISEVSVARPVNNLGGGELRLAMGPSDVVLEVNRTNGSMTIRNQGALAQALAINGYEITSAEGSLINTWAGFENGGVAGFPAGNGTGNGWEKGDASNANSLSEARLVGDSTLGTNQVIGLGTGYSTGADAQDLEFRFSITGGNGLLLPGVVQYVGAPATLFGDYNQNGKVDAADYTVWRNKLGAATLPNENPSQSPGIVDNADYLVWKSNFGSSGSGSAAAAPVPEPTAMAMLFVAIAAGSCFVRQSMSRRRVTMSTLLMAAALPLGAIRDAAAATPDALYLFGDNTTSVENGAPNVEVGQGAGADVPGFTYDHFGNLSVPTTFRDLGPEPDTAGQRPVYVNTANLQYPGTSLGSTTTGIGIQFDGVNDRLRGPGLGYPQDGDNAFTDAFADAYFTLTTRIIDGWVRPTNLNGTRQDVVNDTYQFGIQITANNTWGINFGSSFGEVDTETFDSGVTVASTQDANGWAHVQHRTFGAAAGGLYVNGELVLRTPNGSPFYNAAAGSAAASDLSLVFGANLAGDANFFKGQLDNFRLLVAGDNRGLTTNGKNYGRVDLSLDNDYIAANLTRGDTNGDGVVNGNGTGPAASDDVTFFVNHYGQQQFVTDTNGNSVVAGDITSITTMADLDGSGQTDIFDWYILAQAHINSSGIGSIDLGALLANRGVPEPSSAMLISIALTALAFKRRSRA